ncbi:MAG: hypothetical protein M3003_04990 [Candidatus Dormibacteraeota bacterium]|nr:hypothetical protein [Candidatus Dormibacteraeota bacterium]
MLAAAYESTPDEVTRWMESGDMPGHDRAGPGQAPTRSAAPGDRIASCYFDGSITFRGPLPYGASPPTFQRMLVLLDPTGKVLMESGGTRELYPLVRPK